MQRNAITWPDDDKFIFDLITDAATSSSDEDEEILWQNPAADDYSCGMEPVAEVNFEPQPITFSVTALLGALRNPEDEV